MDIRTDIDYPLCCELVCDTSSEQPVEGEFTLPEYGPEVFRIIKTIAQPEIVQRVAAGARATVEGYVRLTVLYISESGGRLGSTVQRLPFSRQFELASPVGDRSEIYASASLTYINCRAVNERRIDARGAITISLRVLSCSPRGAVKDAFGPGVQLKKSAVPYWRERAGEEKQFTLDEDLEFGAEGCDSPRLLRADVRAVVEGVELSARRAVASGYINAKLAADVSVDGELRVRRAGFNLPFSQVIELNADAEGAEARVSASVISFAAQLENDGTATLSATCALELRLFERAEAEFVSDMFSTRAELEFTRAPLALAVKRDEIREPLTVKFSGADPGELVTLVDYFVSDPVFTPAPDEGGVRGLATLCCIASDALGELAARDYPFEFVVRTDSAAASGPFYRLSAVFENVDCSLEPGGVSLRCEGEVHGSAALLERTDAVASAAVRDGGEKPLRRPALRIYYAREGEELWDIARRFDVSAEDIALENGIEGRATDKAGPLLVPAAI